MAEPVTKRYAVVTGANKGIGFEICKQLASHGITVVLTARDEKRGIESVEKLKGSGLSDDLVIFHQLDVTDPDSVASLAEFVKTIFGKLDILVNNAGTRGAEINGDALKNSQISYSQDVHKMMQATGDIKLNEILTETNELAEQCLQTNFYGAKRITGALIPLLQLSDSPTIVNVSSSMGKLKGIQNEWAKEILSDGEKLTEDRVDEVVKGYLKHLKEGSVQANGWPTFMSAYVVSKAALTAYTRVLAKSYPTFCINAICPSYVKTEANFNLGTFTVEEGAECIVKLALLPKGGPSGLFFFRGDVSSFE